MLTLQNDVVITTDDFVDLSSFEFIDQAAVDASVDGDDSLAGSNNERVVGDMFYTKAEGGMFIMDVDGNGDVNDNDIKIFSPEDINATDMIVRINTDEGNDTIRLGQGQDIIDAGTGDDTFVVVGKIGPAEVTTYTADATDGTMDSIEDAVGDGSVDLSYVVDESELLETREVTEAGNDVLEGGAGDDAIHVYGEADLTGMTLNSIETMYVHSTVTISLSQLYMLNEIVFDANTSHTLIIEDELGNECNRPVNTSYQPHLSVNN